MIKKHHEEEDEEEEDEENVVKDTSLPNYLLGSLSTDFGADTSLLTSQLELHSREEKINQIILLKVSGFLFFIKKKISDVSPQGSFQGLTQKHSSSQVIPL